MAKHAYCPHCGARDDQAHYKTCGVEEIVTALVVNLAWAREQIEREQREFDKEFCGMDLDAAIAAGKAFLERKD